MQLFFRAIKPTTKTWNLEVLPITKRFFGEIQRCPLFPTETEARDNIIYTFILQTYVILRIVIPVIVTYGN
jgi:hypothetical protein